MAPPAPCHRAHRGHQALRSGAWPSTTSRCRSTPASSSACWDRPAAARRRRSTSSAASSRSRRASCASRAVRVNDLPPHKRNVNTVFQNYALFPHMTVAENVAFGLRMEGLGAAERYARVDEYLELVGLAGFGGRFPRSSRAASSSAWRWPVRWPSVPPCCSSTSRSVRWTSSCAARCRSSCRASTARSARPSCSSPTTRRRRSRWRRGSPSCRGGRVIQVGTPREIYLRPVDRFVADFIGESNFLDGGVDRRRRRFVAARWDAAGHPARGGAGPGHPDGAARGRWR